MSFRYRALGLDITSSFPCSGFRPSQTATTGRDITVELGAVPESLDDLIYDRPLTQIRRDGVCLHRVPGIARYLIRERGMVMIEILPGATLERAITFLRGTPMALLCHQWGLVPLKAATVSIDGRAVLLSGSAACGKSTLALALALRGHDMLSDDICAFDATDPARPVVWPSFPEVRLWPDSLEALAPTLPASPPGPGGCQTVNANGWFQSLPVAPGAILVLDSTRGGLAPQCRRLSGLKAFQATMNAVLIPDIVRLSFHDQIRMAPAARLASLSAVLIFRHPAGLEHVASQADRVLEAVTQAL